MSGVGSVVLGCVWVSASIFVLLSLVLFCLVWFLCFVTDASMGRFGLLSG